MIGPDWSKTTWRRRPAKQQPAWLDPTLRDEVLDQIARLPALVYAGESRALKADLAEAAAGRAFVLQAGDCAERFVDCHGPAIHDLLKVILRMAVILTYAGEKKVVKIARLAGQYAKPRSADTEEIGGRTLPSYRGDMVNGVDPTEKARLPDPRRMLEGYFRATATLNLVRAFTTGGYAALDHAHTWSEIHHGPTPVDPKYAELVEGIRKALRFMAAVGLDFRAPQLGQVALYTSHEALLLEYEEALARIDTTTGDWYDTSANMLWIGDRTRQPQGAHVEFLSGVRNPLGLKIGPSYETDDILHVLDRLDPQGEPGRISLITRLGADAIADRLPPLIAAVRAADRPVVWICDPMHGNTRLANGRKTRSYDDILSEIQQFWDIHAASGTIPGGVHLELTGAPVTECLGGCSQLGAADLALNYQTHCDPRLNADQAVELAFAIARIIHP